MADAQPAPVLLTEVMQEDVVLVLVSAVTGAVRELFVNWLNTTLQRIRRAAQSAESLEKERMKGEVRRLRLADVPHDDPELQQLRAKMQRNIAAARAYIVKHGLEAQPDEADVRAALWYTLGDPKVAAIVAALGINEQATAAVVAAAEQAAAKARDQTAWRAYLVASGMPDDKGAGLRAAAPDLQARFRAWNEERVARALPHEAVRWPGAFDTNVAGLVQAAITAAIFAVGEHRILPQLLATAEAHDREFVQDAADQQSILELYRLRHGEARGDDVDDEHADDEEDTLYGLTLPTAASVASGIRRQLADPVTADLVNALGFKTLYEDIIDALEGRVQRLLARQTLEIAVRALARRRRRDPQLSAASILQLQQHSDDVAAALSTSMDPLERMRRLAAVLGSHDMAKRVYGLLEGSRLAQHLMNKAYEFSWARQAEILHG